MHECRCEVPRKPWELPFLAEAREVAGLRRVMRLHLTTWGLPNVIEAAQLCVTELVSNVVRHVGSGTPATLAVSTSGPAVRIEIRDPDARALPTLVSTQVDDEEGRGMALVDATAERWGVVLKGDSKITWCELATGLDSARGHFKDVRVSKAEAVLAICSASPERWEVFGQMGVREAQRDAVILMADLLHWMRAHGCDPNEALDRAQMLFEAEAYSDDVSLLA
ncbi:ATP-binding protein [Streptomyces sp. PR69]|uniref:ATP-binding protein n=1 Tax=Streptomyces sp. PR69 TaxID=2984950 RepID=UPI0022644D96|nr:ATP-binding protein [Streptomyces sp. PR69]